MEMITLITIAVVCMTVLSAVFVAVLLISRRSWQKPGASFDPVAMAEAAMPMEMKAPSSGSIQQAASGGKGMGLSGSLIFVTAFGLPGLIALGIAAFQVFTGLSATTWPGTQGTIETSYLAEHSDSDGTTYSSEIVYRYVVEDRIYTNDRVHVGDDVSSSGRRPAQRRVDRYPVGMSVTVRYDPANPQNSLLEPGLSWGILFPLGFGLIFSAVGLGTLIGSAATIRTALSSREWPSVPGEVISANVISYRDSDGDTMYRPRVVYRYELGGVTYESDRVNLSGSMATSGTRAAEKTVAAYPPGSTVEVYYDPANPASCLLQRGTGRISLSLLMAVGGLVLMLIISVLVFLVLQ